MRVIYSDEKLQLNNTVVILGNFDGVHIAHQSLVKEAIRIAKNKLLTSVVYTFFEHPQNIFEPQIDILTTNQEKEKLFAELGVDILVYQHIDKEFLSISPEDFIKRILINSLGAKAIVVGEHYSFGYNASGNSNMLKEFSKKTGVDTHILPLQLANGEIVSSSGIRKLITCGEIKSANELLGRKFEISGIITHGSNIGSKLGFPTANVCLNTCKVIPKFGVYACKVTIENEEYYAVTNIGVKPTFGSKKPLAEIHLIDTDGDFYGKSATIKLCEFIRQEEKFDDVDSLKKQIKQDINVVKEYFL